MIHSVYNYIISNQIFKNNSRSNVVKRNELSETYHSILRMSSRSPLYLVSMTEQNSDFAIGLKEIALDLQNETDMIFLSSSSLLADDGTLSIEKTDSNTDYKLDILTDFSVSYNQLIDLAAKQQKTSNLASHLLWNINQLIQPHKDLLSTCGIELDQQQKMSINIPEAVLALDNNMFEQLYQDNTSFFHAFQNRMYTLSLDPMEYIDKIMITYPNPFRPAFTNPYITSIYSGMLFNGYC